MEKRQRGQYGPVAGSVYLLFVDDFNMPAKEEFGAQPPLELLRQVPCVACPPVPHRLHPLPCTHNAVATHTHALLFYIPNRLLWA